MSHQRKTRLTRLVATTAVITLSVLGVSNAAFAEPDEQSTAIPTVIILDASGSMLANDAPGSRIVAARKAVHELVDGLPPGAELGLVVYGTGTGSRPDEKAAGCEDVNTLVPVGPLSRDAFLSTVDGIEASGYTPIGNALILAAAELPSEGPRSIVLVSDGIDTCAPPPPCEVAADLAASGVDFTIHTVGFKVDAAARADLECIATVTGGSYSNADSAEALARALKIRVDHAMGSYDASGEPVEGAASIEEQPPLLEPGQYVDTFATGGDTISRGGTNKFYRIEVPEGWTARAAVTMVLPPDTKDDDVGAMNVQVAFFDSEQRQCTFDVRHLNWTNAPGAPATATISSEECASAPEYIGIQRFGKRFEQTPATAEILVDLEPPADATGLPSPEIGDPAPAPEPTEDVISIDGGLSFNSATQLIPGQTYESTVVTGEFRYFKLPVTWGQHLSYRIDMENRDDPESKEWLYVRGNWYNPMRVELSELTQVALDMRHRNDGFAPLFEGGSTEPVRYGSEIYGLAGDYYFVIGPNPAKESDPFQFTFRLTADAVGEPEPGPAYDISAVSEVIEPTIEPTEETSAPEDDAVPSSDAALDVMPDGDRDSGGGLASPVLWVGGAVLLLVAAGATTLAVLKRRP